MKFKSCCTYCLFIGGIIFFITSFVLLIVWPYLYYRILSEQLVLSPTSTSYDVWHDVPIPMYMEMHMFNFTNTEEVAANHSVKPMLEELGPYVFRERNVKVNETWYDDNSTISYFQNRTWHFVPEMSNGSLTDEVTNINVILATVGRPLKGTNSVWMGIISNIFQGMEQNIFITKTVQELLYDGYEDDLLDIGNLIDNLPAGIPINVQDLVIPFDKFGWFYGRNGSYTYDGEFNIFTGASDVSKLGIMNMWNRENKTTFYGDGCNDITGSTGELWPFNIEDDNIKLFVSDFCGALNLKHAEDVSIEGITGSMFVGDDSVFDNGWHYPETACFCPADRSLCKPSGVLDISACRFDAPAFISFPHFYLADESYRDAIDGLATPNREDDEFRIVLERNIGLPLLVRAQLQINIFVEHFPGFRIVNDRMPEKLMPMVRFKQEVKVTEEYAGLAKLIINMRWGANILLYCVLSVSIVAIATAIALFMSRHLRQDPEAVILVQDSD